MADKPDAAKATKLQAGEFDVAGATIHHYALTKGRTIVQVHAMARSC